MAIILWTAFAAIILLQTFGSIPTRVLGDELYAILAPAIFVGPGRHMKQLMFLRLALRPQRFMLLLRHRRSWSRGSERRVKGN